MLSNAETVFKEYTAYVHNSGSEKHKAAMKEFWKRYDEFKERYINEFQEWNQYYYVIDNGIGEIVIKSQNLINDLLEKLAKKRKRINNITARLLEKVFEIVKRRSSFQDFIEKQSSDENTKRMLEASKMTINSGIESDLNDMISTVRERIQASDTMETLSNKPIQEHESFFEVLEYEADNKMIYDLVNAVELSLLFKWSLNKTIYDNKQFLIEDIYKNPFVVYYIQEYILKHDERKKSFSEICNNFVNKVVFDFIESAELISPTNKKEFKDVFSKEYMKLFKDIIKTHIMPAQPTRSKRKRLQSESINSSVNNKAVYSRKQVKFSTKNK